MTDAEIRIECIKAAASTPGNPNHVQMAREYYEFVTEGVEAPAAVKAVKKGGAK